MGPSLCVCENGAKCRLFSTVCSFGLPHLLASLPLFPAWAPFKECLTHQKVHQPTESQKRANKMPQHTHRDILPPRLQVTNKCQLFSCLIIWGFSASQLSVCALCSVLCPLPLLSATLQSPFSILIHRQSHWGSFICCFFFICFFICFC